MAKKNSIEQGVHFNVPSVRELEGTIISISPAGVTFRYRKAGGSTMLTEYFPFNEKLYAVIGNEGKEGRLLLAGTKEIFGKKVRNTCNVNGVSGFAPGFVTAEGPKEIGTVVLNSNFAEFRAEEASESGGRGRKPAASKEKKASKEKPTKEDKKKSSKPSKKAADDWDDE